MASVNDGAAEVAVVGAGIVGLAATAALEDAGTDVRCFEHAEPGSGQSAGRVRVFRQDLFNLAPLLGSFLRTPPGQGTSPPNSALRLDRARSGDSVELIRVVENGCLGRSRGPRIVVSGHEVEQLRGHVRIEPAGPLFDEPEAEVHVAEKTAFGGREKERTAVQFSYPARVVQERSGE